VLPEALKMNPFAFSAKLQRRLCDFAWEVSFAQTNRQLQEHYGFELPVERIRQNALKHAKIIESEQHLRPEVTRLKKDGAEQLIAQADGSMIRLVEVKHKEDGKYKKELLWKECRLTAATTQGSSRVVYASTFHGVEDTGKRWGQCAEDADWGTQSRIHCVGDGAVWIEEQSKNSFGTQGSYLVDIFHVCEYLAEASHICAKKEPPSRWCERHKNMLKKGKINQVINNLSSYIEADHIPDEDAPVRKALRYIRNKAHALDYPHAIENNLPIGSGLIESGHKHVLQKRLKGSGMAWLAENAQAMAQARCHNASGNWEKYWDKSAA
jgi:hypothetical protein